MRYLATFCMSLVAVFPTFGTLTTMRELLRNPALWDEALRLQSGPLGWIAVLLLVLLARRVRPSVVEPESESRWSAERVLRCTVLVLHLNLLAALFVATLLALRVEGSGGWDWFKLSVALALVLCQMRSGSLAAAVPELGSLALVVLAACQVLAAMSLGSAYLGSPAFLLGLLFVIYPVSVSGFFFALDTPVERRTRAVLQILAAAICLPMLFSSVLEMEVTAAVALLALGLLPLPWQSLDAALARDPNAPKLTGSDGSRFPLRTLDVEARLSGTVANVRVRQLFANQHSRPVEAVYTFPLPGRSAVYDFKLIIGGTTIEGKVIERGKAREVYHEAIAGGRQAGLLEQQRDNVFTVCIGNVMPGDEVSVELTYCERLETSSDGETEFRFPVMVGSRYRSRPPVNPSGWFRQAIQVHVDAGGKGLQSIACHGHKIDQQVTRGGVLVRMLPSASTADFVLHYALRQPEISGTLFTCKGHFLLHLQPPSQPDLTTSGRNVLILVDRSGSMRGKNLETAQAAIHQVLDGLSPGDEFVLVSFNTTTEHFRPHWTHGGESDAAKAWAAKIQPGGGTDILGALDTALHLSIPRKREAIILLITDGQVDNEEEIYTVVQRRNRRGRLFTLGIDNNVNDAFLRRIAALGGGSCELVVPGFPVKAALARLSREIFTLPLLSHVQLLETEDVAPAPLPSVSGARPLWAVGRLSPGQDKITVTARVPATGAKHEQVVTATEVDNPAIARLWAREKISALEDLMRLRGSSQRSYREQLIKLSVQYNLVSSLTSYVVVSDAVVTTTRPPQAAWQQAPPSLAASAPLQQSKRCESTLACVSVPTMGIAVAAEQTRFRRAPAPAPEIPKHVRVELGRDLLPWLDPRCQEHGLVHTVERVREHLSGELGFTLPLVVLSDNLGLKAAQYRISLANGQELGCGELEPDAYLALGSPEQLAKLPGTRAKDPAYGEPAVWTTDQHLALAEGCLIFSAPLVLASHLSELMRRNADHLLTYDEIRRLCQALHLPAGMGQKLVAAMRTALALGGSLHELQKLADLLVAGKSQGEAAREFAEGAQPRVSA